MTVAPIASIRFRRFCCPREDVLRLLLLLLVFLVEGFLVVVFLVEGFLAVLFLVEDLLVVFLLEDLLVDFLVEFFLVIFSLLNWLLNHDLDLRLTRANSQLVVWEKHRDSDSGKHPATHCQGP